MRLRYEFEDTAPAFFVIGQFNRFVVYVKERLQRLFEQLASFPILSARVR